MTSANELTLQENSICGIVVSYNPTVGILTNVTALSAQVDHVVVVDNGSEGESCDYLRQLGTIPNVSLVYHNANLGIATALNTGVQWALRYHYRWVATFDQDSQVTLNMLTLMLEAYEAFPDQNRIAIISPQYRDQSTGRIMAGATRKQQDNVKYARVLTTMTSGNLVNTNIFQSVGFFEDAMFIDLVDAEFCLRCARAGYVIIEAQQALLDHNLGRPSQHKLFWKRPFVSNHSAIRRYYITRNKVFVYKNYARSYPVWVLVDIYAYMKDCIGLVLFEQDRKNKINFIVRGIWDGIRGRLGPL